MIVSDGNREDDGATTAHHVLQRRERGALAANLGGGTVLLGLEMRARMHGHAELGEQERQRQPMDDEIAIASNQAGPPRKRSITAARAIDNLQLLKLAINAPDRRITVLPNPVS